MKHVVLAGILFVICMPLCFAQGGPPVITDDPETPGTNHWEINTAFVSTVLSHPTEYQVPFLDFNYGAGERVQLKFQVPFNFVSSHFGMGNPQVGMKIRFLDESKRGFSFSTYPQFTFGGTASAVQQDLASPGWQMFLPVEASKIFGTFQVDGEIGSNMQQQSPNEIWLDIVGAYEPTERIKLLAEVHEIEARRFNENEPVFDLGTRLKLTKLTTLLFTAGRSLPGTSGEVQKFFSFLGIQFTF
jgi:hypothetical protein